MTTESGDGVLGNVGVMERGAPSHSLAKRGGVLRHLETFSLGPDKDLYPHSVLREDTAAGAELRIGEICGLFGEVHLFSRDSEVQPSVGDRELNLYVLGENLPMPATTDGYVPASELGLERLPIGVAQDIRRLLLPQGRGQSGILRVDGRCNLCHLRANGTGPLYCVYFRWSVSAQWWKIGCCLPRSSIWEAGTYVITL
jgi:hypothetical protein